MGAKGAGLATALGSIVSILVMLTHFLTKNNTLRLVRPSRPFYKFREIFVTGFSTFIVDIAVGVLTILFNRQIMTYLGTNALSVYGVIVNINTLNFIENSSLTVCLLLILHYKYPRHPAGVKKLTGG